VSPVALSPAFVAGLVSFVSPCCLPMVPIYLSYLAGIAGLEPTVATLASLPATFTVTTIAVRAPPSRTLIMLHAAAAGFSVIFVALGASASVLGVLLCMHLLLLRHGAGILIVLFGLHAAGLLRISWLYRERRAHRPHGWCRSRAQRHSRPGLRGRVVALHRSPAGLHPLAGRQDLSELRTHSTTRLRFTSDQRPRPSRS